MTIQLHMDSHEGTYTKEFNAKVEATFPGIIELDKTAFYHLGGQKLGRIPSYRREGG